MKLKIVLTRSLTIMSVYRKLEECTLSAFQLFLSEDEGKWNFSWEILFLFPVICLKHICYKVKRDIMSELPGERSDCSFNFTVTAGKVRFFNVAVNVFWERIVCSVPFVWKFFRDLLLQKQPRITSTVRVQQNIILLMTIKKSHNWRSCCPKASLKDYCEPQDILAYVHKSWK